MDNAVTAQSFEIPAVREAFLGKIRTHYGQHGHAAAKGMTPSELADLARAFAEISKSKP